YGASRSAIDSAITQAYRYRDRLPDTERALVTARYFALGPGRDRGRAIVEYERVIGQGETIPAVLTNLAEQLRTRREFARAESLNAASARLQTSGTALGNLAELQMDQGKFKEAEETVARLGQLSRGYGVNRGAFLAFAKGDYAAVRATRDTAIRAGGDARRLGLHLASSMALLDGRLHDYARARDELGFARLAPQSDDGIFDVNLALAINGPSPALAARLDSVIAAVPFRTLPPVDQPYLSAAATLARIGSADRARAMLTRYRAEMTDTSLLRAQQPDVHRVLAEIALATGNTTEALAEFRRSDRGSDGFPVDECAPCLSFDLGRVFDAARMPDSAAFYFERYLATPYAFKLFSEMDPVRLPAIRERLGQLYESMGKTDKAVENYSAFIELWKNAEPELQPRVADARKRLARLTPVEKGRP
ncbi:MAG TPA: hypothetical protein VI259_09620, partial [Gemmatimonadaceae bacterium]